MPTPSAPSALLRHLPAIAALCSDAAWHGVAAPEALRVAVCREVVAEVRAAVAAGSVDTVVAVQVAVATALRSRVVVLAGPTLQPLLNGSGVLLHTNAGRAPLPQAAQQELVAATSGYNTLELDIATGQRGSRQNHCAPLLRWLTGAQDALVVNNGAAAALLALRSVARGRPVVVSRGELVEIGGGFRVHEVMAEAGCTLVEVGATNRTHLHDYAAALQDLQAQGRPAAAVLVVHRSNFAIIGFAGQPALSDLAQLAHDHGAALVVDLGSGAFVPLPVAPAELPDGSRAAIEPTVAQTLAQGADVVTFSGDKLVGGPQAGLLVGRRDLLAPMHRDPLLRALRPGGLVLAGLAAVLRVHALGQAPAVLPALRQMTITPAQIAQLAAHWAALLGPALPVGGTVTVVASTCAVGGGTHPLYVLPSRALALQLPDRDGADLARMGMAALPPVLGRAKGDQWLLDVRTLGAHATSDTEQQAVLAALARAVGGDPSRIGGVT